MYYFSIPKLVKTRPTSLILIIILLAVYSCNKKHDTLTEKRNKLDSLHVSQDISAQTFNLRADRDNISHDQAIINTVFLNVFGEEKVSDWLKNDVVMKFLWTIDSIGNVKAVKQMPHRKSIALTDQELLSVIDYMNSKHILLPYCVDDDPHTDFVSHEYHAKLSYAKDHSFSIYTGFPGMAYLQEKYKKNGHQLSDLEYLKNSIKKYLSPTIRETIVCQNIKTYENDIVIPFDTIPQMHNDPFFFDAYDELSAMLDERIRCDFKRATFLVEQAFNPSVVNYNSFYESIAEVTSAIKNYKNDHNISINKALIDYVTNPYCLNHTNTINNEEKNNQGNIDSTRYSLSITISKQLEQINALVIYYKLLCDELNEEVFISSLPEQLFIKIPNNDRQSWINVELEYGGMVSDDWLVKKWGISPKAIESGLFLSNMTDKEEIAYMLYMLAVAYQRKYGCYDFFSLQCANRILEIFPNNYHALSLSIEIRRQWKTVYSQQMGETNTRFIVNNQKQCEAAEKTLFGLGYEYR